MTTPLNEKELREICVRLGEGDRLALQEMYVLFSDRLFHFAYGFLRSRELAEEAVADVFIQIWKQASRLAQIENPSFYLFRATRNICTNYHKKYLRRQPLPLEDVELPYYTSSASAEELLIAGDMLTQLHLALNQLPPRCRLIFRLVKEDGLRYREVAELLGLSPKTVESQMAIAFKRICEALPAQWEAFRKQLPSR